MVNGEALAVQMKDVTADDGVDWQGLVRTELKGRKQPDWLQAGDILVLIRGNRNIAICLGEVPVRAVCSPHFFMVQIKPKADILPEFLAWQINQPLAQNYFEQFAEGTLQRSIRRQVLEQLPVVVPPLAIQETVVHMVRAALREKQTLQALITNRERQMLAVAGQVLN
ncbi:MAG: restriction endonuclease subunit S [Magnetococcus sp. YQC-3]